MNRLRFFPGGRSILSETRDAISDYRRLLNALGSRARRMGSRDPESAAQETLKRSLEHAAFPARDRVLLQRRAARPKPRRPPGRWIN